MGICCVAKRTQTGALGQSRRVGLGRKMGGRREGGDMGVPVADSCRCLTEQQKFCNSPSIKK